MRRGAGFLVMLPEKACQVLKQFRGELEGLSATLSADRELTPREVILEGRWLDTKPDPVMHVQHRTPQAYQRYRRAQLANGF